MCTLHPHWIACPRCGVRWWRLCAEAADAWHARMVAYGWHGRCPRC